MNEGRESTRQRMLEAGVELWESESPAELFGGLSVASVARAAGVTRTTFYAYWSSTEEYLLDLTRHLADPEWGTDPELPGRGAEALRGEGTRLVERFLEASDIYIERLAADRRLRLRYGLMAKIDDPGIAEGLRTVFNETEKIRSRIFSGAMPAWGRVTRPPIENHHLQAAFSALAEGLAMRHVLEPERFPVRIYGLLGLSLLFITSARAGDGQSRDLYSVIEVANDWTSTAAARRNSTATDIAPPLPVDAIRELVIQARRVASSEGWLDLTLPGLAAITNTPEARVTRAFGSKFGLGMAMFMLNVSERYDDLDPELGPIETVRAMIEINIDELQRTPAIAQAIVTVMAGGATFGRPATFGFDPHPRFVAALQRAQDAGQIDPDIDCASLGNVIGRAILLSNLPTTGGLVAGIDEVELVLRGAGIAPASD